MGFLRHLLPARKDHIEHSSKIHGDSSWQLSLITFIHSRSVQWVLFVLLLLDVVGIFTRIFLESAYPPCVYVVRDAVCADGQTAQCLKGRAGNVVEWLGNFVEVTSPFILLVFLTENIAMLLAIGCRRFFSHMLYTMDLAVVVISVILESYVHHENDADEVDEVRLAENVAEVLILSRLWRFITLTYDLLSIEHDKNENMICGLNDRVAYLEHRLETSKEEIETGNEYHKDLSGSYT